MNEVLHTLRVKGRATAEEVAWALGRDVADIEPQLRGLGEGGMAIERTTGRRPGWMLTSAGREHHQEEQSESLSGDQRDGLGAPYETFLRVNQRVKTACAAWQTEQSDDGRFDILEDLREIQEVVDPALGQAGTIVPRFARYGERLRAALEGANEDPRYVVSPQVDSYHTVWFECHEDFLVTLGRSRSDEGSL